MRGAAIAVSVGLMAALFASTAQARCSWRTDAVVLFEPSASDCQSDGDACGMFNIILDQAAETWRQAGSDSRLILIGHSDTSASAEQSLALSIDRAVAVRERLVARGVTRELISIEGRGETDLGRPTGDGVVETLNNRVVIDLRDTIAGVRRHLRADYQRQVDAALAAGAEPPSRPPCI